jgi:hypothetical protein
MDILRYIKAQFILAWWNIKRKTIARYNKAMACERCRKRDRVIDLLDKKNYVHRSIRNERYDTCLGCERLIQLTKTCLECGCFMNKKTWLKDASCPLGKW